MIQKEIKLNQKESKHILINFNHEIESISKANKSEKNSRKDYIEKKNDNYLEIKNGNKSLKEELLQLNKDLFALKVLLVLLK